MSKRERSVTSRVLIQLIFFVVVVPLLPLFISWNWNWWEAWVFAILCILGFAVSRMLVVRRHPDLLSERARFIRHEDALPWDRILASVIGLGGGSMPLVAGLDAPTVFRTSPDDKILQEKLEGYREYARLVPHRLFPGIW